MEIHFVDYTLARHLERVAPTNQERSLVPRLTDQTRRARRDTIVRAATECLRERGVRGTAMADIARRAGVSAGSLYVHFPNRQALLAEAARSVLDGRIEQLRSQPDTKPIEIIRTLVHLPPPTTGRADVLLELLAEAGRDEVLAEALRTGPMGSLRSLWRDVLSTRHPDAPEDQVEAQISVLIALTLGYVAQSTLTHLDPANYADAVAAQLSL